MLRKVAADYRQVNEVARALHLEMAAAYLVKGYGGSGAEEPSQPLFNAVKLTWCRTGGRGAEK